MQLIGKKHKTQYSPDSILASESIETFWQFEVVYCDTLTGKTDCVIAEEITVENGNILFHIGGKIIGVVPQKNVYKVVQAKEYQKIELHDLSKCELEEKLKEARSDLEQIMYEIQRKYEGGERRCF